MHIRKAVEKDYKRVNELLIQVNQLHHEGRKDLFKAGGKKYSDDDFKKLIHDENRPIFVAVNENDEVLGYAFCIFHQFINHPIMTDIKTLYIDDLCVDEKYRGQHIGTSLYHYVVDFAKKNDCYNLTLNVWCLNENAMKFYESLGLQPQKIGMETLLK